MAGFLLPEEVEARDVSSVLDRDPEVNRGPSFDLVNAYLEKIGSVGSGPDFEQHRIYHVIPQTHQCGREIGWLIVLRMEEEVVENYGAHCRDCFKKVQFPLERLADIAGDIRFDGSNILLAMESRAVWTERQMRITAKILKRSG